MLVLTVRGGAGAVNARVRVTGGGAGGVAVVDAVVEGVATGRRRPSRSSPVEPNSATLANAAAAAMAATASPIETGVRHLRHPRRGLTRARPAVSDPRSAPPESDASAGHAHPGSPTRGAWSRPSTR